MGFLVDFKHAVLGVKNVSQKEQKKLFGDPASILCFLSTKFNLKNVPFKTKNYKSPLHIKKLTPSPANQTELLTSSFPNNHTKKYVFIK